MNNYANAQNDGRELGWNDAIEHESSFILLPAGEYDFTVKKFERARHPGSEKLPPCNKAVLTLTVHAPQGDVDLTHNLFLHTKCEGILCDFFTCIGQRGRGEKLTMDWNRVIGASGRCKVDVRDWAARDGSVKQSNEVKKFLERKTPLQSEIGAQATAKPQWAQPSQNPTGGTPAYTPGAF